MDESLMRERQELQEMIAEGCGLEPEFEKSRLGELEVD